VHVLLADFTTGEDIRLRRRRQERERRRRRDSTSGVTIREDAIEEKRYVSVLD
jgi:hypothetical protein